MKGLRFALYATLPVAGFIVWHFLVINQSGVFGANGTPQTTSLGSVLYGYVVTLVGVLLGSVYRELQGLRDKGQKQITGAREFIKSLCSSVDLWISLCGSPIVYALLWKSLAGGNSAGLTIVALQNGFCCTMVLGNLVKSGATPQPSVADPVKPPSP